MKKKKFTKLYEWQVASVNAICKCGSNKEMTVDHIVPCNILEQFHLDPIEVLYNLEINFEYLCRYCNKMKAGRIDPRNPKTYEVLEYVINKAKQENL